GKGLRRRHPQPAERHGVRHPGRDALSASQQDAARRAARLRMAGVRRRPAAQVLRAHPARPGAARRADRLLETPQRDDRPAWTVAMQRVISINLNGNAYQIDEAGCDALRDYLDEADRALAGNPDRREIVGDLEQAIADKCQAFLGPHKSVVTADEVAQIIKEMGPIETPAGAAAEDEAGAGDTRAGDPAPRPRRLYRIPEGAMIGGVCHGLGHVFRVAETRGRH